MGRILRYTCMQGATQVHVCMYMQYNNLQCMYMLVQMLTSEATLIVPSPPSSSLRRLSTVRVKMVCDRELRSFMLVSPTLRFSTIMIYMYTYMYKYVKTQLVYLLQPLLNLQETIPVPAQANLHAGFTLHTKDSATYIYTLQTFANQPRPQVLFQFSV